ncbi:desmoglein-2-like [Cheilinus undulatus]|uniref:desmoglein-2-like n=1 Tax=Cheilinus undulatus TaxID=241271 RepID=UPI001BD26ED2|nr:desmoglein-2-like [Cheilinus undulatus]
MDQCMVLLCLFVFQVVAVVKGSHGDNLAREKREWILPTIELIEGKDYTDREKVARIRSDWGEKIPIDYSLEGVGVNKPPYHVFDVNKDNGYIRVTRILDREEIDTYHLLGIAKTKDGTEKEKRIGLKFKVVDVNDNPPVFEIMKAGSVKELSAADTVVMKLNATDRDEPGNINSQIAYSILSQSPSEDMFYVTKDGTVCVKSGSLDREKQDKYVLTVIGSDLNGQPGGNTGTGTVTINIEDVNDNPPILEYEEYMGEIEENTQNVEVMRLVADDKDLEDSKNWETVFEIVKGNEAGYFQMTTVEKTNVGVLNLVKPVDFEKVKSLDLGILVRNKVPHKFKTYPLKINVKNQLEGPRFIPQTKAITVSEGGSVKINDIISKYPATDEDTQKPAEDVTYLKGSDPDNWLSIDSKTAEIKLNKLPDRESNYLINGTYKAEVLCITNDIPRKTATGTVAIQVEDFNDHCPTLTANIQTMCIPADSITVNAKDEDLSPNGAPFTFQIIPEGTEGKWRLEYLNDTAAILRAQEEMWPKVRRVTFLVKDAQGLACPEPQEVDVQVCTCEDGKMCGKKGKGPIKQTGLGPGGIGLLLLGLLLLLLIPLLLLLCQCGAAAGKPGFVQMPFETKQQLINDHTEGQGDNTEVPLMSIPTQVNGETGQSTIKQTTVQETSMGFRPYEFDRVQTAFEERYQSGGAREMMNEYSANGFWSEMDSREVRVRGGLFDGMALPDHILADYYSQKLASGNENLGVKDGFLVFDFEGQGSPAGSVASLSNLGSDNDLQFLDDLGPKFKTLAKICGGKMIQTEVKQVISPTQTSLSSLMATQTLPPLPQPLPTIPKAERTVVKETVKESTVNEAITTVKESTVREGMTTVKEANQGQTLLLQQQPVYYTTTPVLQPMHYVVQPQVQNTMLLAEAPATNLQGMVLVNGAQTMPAQGMVVQGQPVMSTAQVQSPGVVLLQGGGVSSGAQTMMVVEGKGPTGSLKVIKGSQASLVQGGTLPAGTLSGSQRVIVVGGATSSEGQLIQEAGGLSPKISVTGTERVSRSSRTSVASQSSSATTSVSRTPSYRKVVVQETREIL